jgi:serine/threonine protein kinase
MRRHFAEGTYAGDFADAGDPSAARELQSGSECAQPGGIAAAFGSSASLTGRVPPWNESYGSLSILEEFTAAWEGGLAPCVEEYLARLDPADSRGAVELIYREFCLAEAAGKQPEPAHFLARFPQYRAALERLLGLHAACTPSLLGRCVESSSGEANWPRAGDVIGPYVLRRELGRGGFACVFLAAQSNLENRLVVVKIASRLTREPWLMARVRHAHIVEIMSHAVVDDGAFQLICMPFWGGATLTAILAARQRRCRRPVYGADLLADLDSVAAPEYPGVHPARPAREILAGLSYDQAWAWIGARLAEALDHAHSRDVAHGDVKPSNVLLSADGNPMLLDFNLARDGAPAHRGGPSGDLGGTLAYMAPERLQALACEHQGGGGAEADTSAGGCAALTEVRPDPTRAAGPPDPAPHLADIYSLGMVLLETLSGQPPTKVALPARALSEAPPSPVKAAACVYAARRGRSARALIHESESRSGRAITAGLRAILERCLDPDPARRYRCARELAEDLDRWRTNRALAFTSEPFWGQTVPRWLRQQRRTLFVAAAALSLLAGLVTAFAVSVESQANLRSIAQFKLARHWDDWEAQAYRFQRPGDPRPIQADLPRVDAAVRALKDYGVLGPGDWRQRDDVRLLAPEESEDFELWVAEQAYVYCRALEDRPDSPADWQRALKILRDFQRRGTLPALAAIEARLGAKLGVRTSNAPPSSGSTRAVEPTHWGNEYLLGVAAECEPECAAGCASGSAPKAPLGRTAPVSNRPAMPGKAHDDQARAVLARNHYNNFLREHPESYWGHYRAASASYGLGGTENLAAAAAHLQKCLRRRPANSVLRAHLAGCLAQLNVPLEALQESERALEGAPDLAELYRQKVFVRTYLGPLSALAEEEIQHFEALRGLLPRAFRSAASRELGPTAWEPTERASLVSDALDVGARVGSRSAELDGRNVEVSPEEVAVRVNLASRMREAGALELAVVELGKILLLKPDQIDVRMTRAIWLIEAARFDEAARDLGAVLEAPGLLEHLRRDPSFIRRFHHATRKYLTNGKVGEARTLAQAAIHFVLTLKQPRAESHFNLALVYAVSSRTDPEFLSKTVEELAWAFEAHADYRRYYAQEARFNPIRHQIDAAVERKIEEYRRRLLEKPPDAAD